MLLVFLKLKGVIKKYYKDYNSKLKEDLLSYLNWKKLCIIKDFLAPFSQATLTIKGDSIFINCTLFIIDILIKHLQETIISPLLSLFFL
jgi:hypothetical protein